jgi:hypothetical protein
MIRLFVEMKIYITINNQQTTNNKQQTTNSKQQTANSKQQTANSKQQTARRTNAKHSIQYNKIKK